MCTKRKNEGQLGPAEWEAMDIAGNETASMSPFMLGPGRGRSWGRPS